MTPRGPRCGQGLERGSSPRRELDLGLAQAQPCLLPDHPALPRVPEVLRSWRAPGSRVRGE